MRLARARYEIGSRSLVVSSETGPSTLACSFSAWYQVLLCVGKTQCPKSPLTDDGAETRRKVLLLTLGASSIVEVFAMFQRSTDIYVSTYIHSVTATLR